MSTPRQFLVFTLEGPMAAFGEIAVGERRSLWDVPSKSGVFGLIAACLGITRTQEEALSDLNRNMGFAVRVDCAGTPLRDFHTAQTPTQKSRNDRLKKGCLLETRRDDLGLDIERDDLNTVISERLYRVSVRYTVAVWDKKDCRYSLDQIATALAAPVYAPYLGRKSCPLGAPMAPALFETPKLTDALALYDQQIPRTCAASDKELWFELDAGLDAEDKLVDQVRERRDAMRQRQNWHFSNRKEGRLTIKATGDLS